MPSKPSSEHRDPDYLLDEGGLVPLIDEWLRADPTQSWDYLAKRLAQWCGGKWRPSGGTLEYCYERMKAGQWTP